jgi:hypothetical protein
MSGPPTGERLAKIETLMVAAADVAEKTHISVEVFQSEMRGELKAIRKDLADDKAELAALKNRGAGMLIGVGIAGGAIGTTITKAWQWLIG